MSIRDLEKVRGLYKKEVEEFLKKEGLEEYARNLAVKYIEQALQFVKTHGLYDTHEKMMAFIEANAHSHLCDVFTTITKYVVSECIKKLTIH